jgi:predicted nucleic acid-binding protein
VSYLLDTNVVSELRRKAPDANVSEWLRQRPATSLYLSVLTLGEIRKGVDQLVDPVRRLALQDWLQTELPAWFAGRILNVDAKVTACWGGLLARAGPPVPAIDSLLAATAQAHGLTLVTRNVRDVADLGVATINPWER